ncbi:MAG: flagellar biosynthesis protein FlgA [Hyphomicrobiales bacterium]|nr:flagellar biosynthesis protein FlgA [Hyphomicrobiales bacterium]
MNLSKMLQKRAAEDRPVRVGLIGAGKFGSMYLAQAQRTVGVHIVAIADLRPDRARETLRICGWPDEKFAAVSIENAVETGATHLTDDAEAMVRSGVLDVVIEASGDPAAGIRHCLMAIDAGVSIVMVNVEADVVAGPLLAKKAEAAGLVYSLAWGDQPALICEHVDWARTCGFAVVSAGKGTRYHPDYHRLTPDTVWDVLEKYLVISDRSLINPKMFNSFLDGSKSAIEMTAVCNATGLRPQPDGLAFPPATRFELADICVPAGDGGTLSHAGTTEVVSSVYRDETDVPWNLAMGTYVIVEGETDYVRRCFAEYRMLVGKSGRYAALYRPTHMIGLELGISVASVALRREPTGSPTGFHSDVVAVAKRDIAAGEMLDGEGGFCVWGKQQPARTSLANGYLPLGLASGVRLMRAVSEGETLAWSDVDIAEDDPTLLIRREMEREFGA